MSDILLQLNALVVYYIVHAVVS